MYFIITIIFVVVSQCWTSS